MTSEAMNAHPRLSIADALAAFAGQNEFTRLAIARVADAIICTVHGRGDFPVRTDDALQFAEFAKSLGFEAEFQSVGIVPDLGSADAVYREPNCERFELTGEVV